MGEGVGKIPPRRKHPACNHSGPTRAPDWVTLSAVVCPHRSQRSRLSTLESLLSVGPASPCTVLGHPVCVCVEREREKEQDREREREGERGRDVGRVECKLVSKRFVLYVWVNQLPFYVQC